MTTPFWCVLAAIVIPYVLAGAGGYFKSKQLGSVDNHEPRSQSALLEGPGARAVAAQANAWEALPVFASAVIVNHLAGGAAGTAAALSIGFVVSRVLHAVFYIADLAPLRSLAFLAGFVCSIGLFVSAA